MRKTASIFSFIAVVALLGATIAFDVATAGDKHQFVGASKCKMCHKTPESGEQFPLWEKSKHANAYAVLATEEAKKVAAEKGIENPQEADACLKCHVTGHGAPAELLGTKYDKTEGVGCESCHGAGADYYKKKTMVSIITGEIDGATVGLVIPDEKTCKTCHNEESPTFQGFKYEEMVKKIAHPIPEAKKAEYKAPAEG